MKIIPFVIIISMLMASAAVADTVTLLDTPAGVYDDLYAQFDVDQDTGRAFVKVFLMDEESSFRQCRTNLAAIKGISTKNCRIQTQRVKVPGLAYNAANRNITYKGTAVNQNALKTDVHYSDIDDGTRINSVKYVRVELQTQ